MVAKNSKGVFLFLNEGDGYGDFIRYFYTTSECADFFDCEIDYINHVIWLNHKIRKDGVWYRLYRGPHYDRK